MKTDVTMTQETGPAQGEPEARSRLQRAYLMLSFGDVEGARRACAQAAEAEPEHPLPAALAGAVELAAGQLPAALRALRRVTRRWPDAPCGHLYFAEACLLMGRERAGLVALERAEACDARGVWASQIEATRALWSGLEPDQIPSPLRIGKG